MVNWTNHPPTDAGPYAYRIVRTPADKPLTATITCNDLLGTDTHYVNHRTIPCEGPDHCAACQQGYSYRWHGYVSAVLLPGLEHVIIELTPGAAQTLTTYQRAYHDLRGCSLRAHRPSGRPNGRVVLHCKRTDPAKSPLPPAPDLKVILCHIWGIQLDCVADTAISLPIGRALQTAPSKGDGRYRPKQPTN